MLPCCCSTSEPERNKHAGLGHSLVRESGAVEWPGNKNSATPQGLLFPGHGPARATLLCFHGIQTHGAWFAPLAHELTKSGVNVIAMDRRGSGLNTAAPFLKGYTAGPQELLDDVQRQVALAEKLGAPVYLLGTSWSSNLATVYAARGINPRPEGVIMLAPATRSRFETGVSTFLARIGSLFAPRMRIGLPFGSRHYQAGSPQNTPSEQPSPRLDRPGKDEGLEPNKALAQLLERDRILGLLEKKPSFRLINSGLKLAKEAREPGQKADLRLLFILATCDQIMDNGEAWQAALRNANHPARREIAGAGHGVQITHAVDVANCVLEWIAE